MPIRVLQVFGSLNMGGAESRMMDVYREIDRSKYVFDFLTMQTGTQFFEAEINDLGGKVYKIAPPRESGALKNLKEMTDIMKRGGYSAVHAHTSFHCGPAMLAAKRAGVPVRISHSRTTGSKQNGALAKLRLKIGRALIKKYSTCRLAISTEAGKYLFANAAFQLLPNAIDLSRYADVSEADIQSRRTEASLQQDDFVLGLVGRFDRMKNQSFALQILSELLKSEPNAKLIFVGDGPLRESVEAQAKALNLTEHVRFLGVRNDVPVWMHVFDVLLVPSLFEGLGGVILEAQAAGTPVVKSDCFTNESDLSLGLVSPCSLQSIPQWIEAIKRNYPSNNKDKIHARFEERNYTLSSEITTLCRCYSGE